MSKSPILGKRAIILGAGIGGCFAAAAISKFFEETIIVERDKLPTEPLPRPGVPQGTHIHGLLRRPLEIASKLLPGFEDDLLKAGAFSLMWGTESRFHDYGSWHPERETGVRVAAQSRPLLEHVLRQRVLALPGVILRDSTTVVDYFLQGATARGVLVKTQEGPVTQLAADLVIESTGRMSQIVSQLKTHGFGAVDTTELGVDIGYASAYFTRSSDDGKSPHAAVIRSVAPRTRSGVLWPIEDDRWVISLSGRFSDFPPGDDEGFLEYAKTLEHPAIHEVLLKEKRVTGFTRFLIPRIYWRRYEKMQRFPDRLVPIGDTVSVFNPVYGQGMSVASLHAEQLRDLLDTLVEEGATLDGVSRKALPRIASMTEWAWSMTEPVDLIYEKTKGVRPEGFADRIAFSKVIRNSLGDHPELQDVFMAVMNLLAPPEVLRDTAARLGLLDAPART